MTYDGEMGAKAEAPHLYRRYMRKRGHQENDGAQAPMRARYRGLLLVPLYTYIYSIFSETGVFATVCRHGVLLLMSDVIRSGEKLDCDCVFNPVRAVLTS